MTAPTLAPGTTRPLTVRGVAIPSLDPLARYDVAVEDGHLARIDPVAAAAPEDGAPEDGAVELWPGYVEAHGHLALPPNFDDSVDDPEIVALQYLYHGVTHVLDLFGFPLVSRRWAEGAAASALPYPELLHCGYAATSMRDAGGRTGHGVEFPAPVFMLGAAGDADAVLRANRERGASFLKLMFTDGTEQPDTQVRFSRLSAAVLADVARATAEQGVPAILDCNTRAEVMQAYAAGFRLFAHAVRDVELSDVDWAHLEGARFVSTLSGLRPMIMSRAEFEAEYARPGFGATQDPANLAYVAGVEEPFGVRFGCQESRIAALADMRANSLAALRRGAMLVGTDCGNTGAFHGYSLLGELDLLAGDGEPDEELRSALRTAITFGNRALFDELAGRPGTDPLAVGAPATFNLIAPANRLSDLPQWTVIDGVPVDRAAVAGQIRALRGSPTRGKVTL
jgi:hypothetical protein